MTNNRQLAGRAEAIEELTAKEVLDEKLAVQRALLYVESLHGRPASYRHKDLLRPLYDRYRILKVFFFFFILRFSYSSSMLTSDILEMGSEWW